MKARTSSPKPGTNVQGGAAANQENVLVPAEIANELEIALREFDELGSAAVALAVQNGASMHVSVNEDSRYEKICLPRVADGCLGLAKIAAEAFDAAFAKWRGAIQVMLNAAAGCAQPVRFTSLESITDAGINGEHYYETHMAGRELDSASSALRHCIEIQGNILCDGGMSSSLGCARFVCERLAQVELRAGHLIANLAAALFVQAGLQEKRAA